MPLLRVEAEKLSLPEMEAGIIEEILDLDETFALLPFVGVDGKAYLYNREGTLGGASWIDVNTDIPQSAATFQEVTAKLRILAGDVDVDKFLDTTMSNVNDQVAVQLAAKAKGVAREFSNVFVSGDSATDPLKFDGLAKLVTAGQTLTAGANGAAISLSMLDELKDMIPLGVDCFVMRKGTWRAIKQLMRAAGGTTPEMIQLENFGKPVPSFDGVPVILNDFLPTNEVQGSANNTCSIYAVRFNEADGVHAIYARNGAAGMVVEDIGTVQNRDARRWRIKWYVGLVLKSTKSLARLKGVTNI